MRFLGIDYGQKNIGLAISDKDETLAFPLSVLKNDKETLKNLKEICLKKGVNAVVLGESLDLKGKPNPVMEHIENFKREIEKEITKDVFLEPEFYTTRQSKHIQGDSEMSDASAATIILQSFLDKRKNSTS